MTRRRLLSLRALIVAVAVERCGGGQSDGSGPTDPPDGNDPPASGTLVVTTATSGLRMPVTKRHLAIDGASLGFLELTDTASFEVMSGNHTLTLEIPTNCTIADGATKAVVVRAGGTATVHYDITCALDLPGHISILPAPPIGIPDTGNMAEVAGLDGTVAPAHIWPHTHISPLRLAPDGQRFAYAFAVFVGEDIQTKIAVSGRDASDVHELTQGPRDEIQLGPPTANAWSSRVTSATSRRSCG